jgi:hypothetical protein
MAVAMRGELAEQVILHADRGCQTGSSPPGLAPNGPRQGLSALSMWTLKPVDNGRPRWDTRMEPKGVYR